jgi:hypothetical protein
MPPRAAAGERTLRRRRHDDDDNDDDDDDDGRLQSSSSNSSSNDGGNSNDDDEIGSAFSASDSGSDGNSHASPSDDENSHRNSDGSSGEDGGEHRRITRRMRTQDAVSPRQRAVSDRHVDSRRVPSKGRVALRSPRSLRQPLHQHSNRDEADAHVESSGDEFASPRRGRPRAVTGVRRRLKRSVESGEDSQQDATDSDEAAQPAASATTPTRRLRERTHVVDYRQTSRRGPAGGASSEPNADADDAEPALVDDAAQEAVASASEDEQPRRGLRTAQPVRRQDKLRRRHAAPESGTASEDELDIVGDGNAPTLPTLNDGRRLKIAVGLASGEESGSDDSVRAPRRRSARRSSGSHRKSAAAAAAHRAEPELVCSFCLGTEACNRDNKPEILLSCWKCGSSGHPSCLQFSPELVAKVQTYPWLCIECKDCVVCGDPGHEDKLMFCDTCDRGFHTFCLDPPFPAPPDGEWSCALCRGLPVPSLNSPPAVSNASVRPSAAADPAQDLSASAKKRSRAAVVKTVKKEVSHEHIPSSPPATPRRRRRGDQKEGVTGSLQMPREPGDLVLLDGSSEFQPSTQDVDLFRRAQEQANAVLVRFPFRKHALSSSPSPSPSSSLSSSSSSSLSSSSSSAITSRSLSIVSASHDCIAGEKS